MEDIKMKKVDWRKDILKTDALGGAPERHDTDVVWKHLKYAEGYNLQPEVVWSAIKYAQSQPDWSVEQVLFAACGDWDVNP